MMVDGDGVVPGSVRQEDDGVVVTPGVVKEYIEKGSPVFTAVWSRGRMRIYAYNVLPRPVVVPPPFLRELKEEGLERVPRVNSWVRDDTVYVDRRTLIMHRISTSMAPEVALAYLYAARRLRSVERLRRLDKCIRYAMPDALALGLIGEALLLYAPHIELKPRYAMHPADKLTRILWGVCNLCSWR